MNMHRLVRYLVVALAFGMAFFGAWTHALAITIAVAVAYALIVTERNT